jgi:tetratricopeptide (TPR) repeat protein
MRLTHGHDSTAARDLHSKALELFEKRASADPSDLDARARVAETLYLRATCLLHLGDATAAATDYHRCLEIRQALAKDPSVKGMEVNLMLALARCGQHAEAAKIAAALVATPPKDEHLYFQSACGYALAAAAGDSASAKQYTDAALACLRNAKSRGWADVNSLETDPDLEPIRKNPAFQALLADFRKTGGNRP